MVRQNELERNWSVRVGMDWKYVIMLGKVDFMVADSMAHRGQTAESMNDAILRFQPHFGVSHDQISEISECV